MASNQHIAAQTFLCTTPVKNCALPLLLTAVLAAALCWSYCLLFHLQAAMCWWCVDLQAAVVLLVLDVNAEDVLLWGGGQDKHTPGVVV